MRVVDGLLLIALTGALSWGTRQTHAREEDPCSGISFRYYEWIEPQGLFGLATPKADANTIGRALTADPFYLGYIQDLCEKARPRGIRQLTFGCSSDKSGKTVMNECLVSSSTDSDPSFGELREKSVGGAAGDHFSDDPSREIKSPALRARNYESLLKAAILSVPAPRPKVPAPEVSVPSRHPRVSEAEARENRERLIRAFEDLKRLLQ